MKIITAVAKRAVNFYKFSDFYAIEKEVDRPQWNNVKVRGKLSRNNKFENRTIREIWKFENLNIETRRLRGREAAKDLKILKRNVIGLATK